MTEQEFLNNYDAAQYEKPSVAVDLVLFTILDGTLQVLLTKREEHPFQGYLALPGVFVGMDETLDAAAAACVRDSSGTAALQGKFPQEDRRKDFGNR